MVASSSFPDIPEALLGLTSLAAATYVGAKAVARGGLRLVDISPRSAAHGSTVTVSLVNASDPLTQSMVSVQYTNSASVVTTLARASIPLRAGVVTTFTAAIPGAAGTYGVVVVTPDGSTPSVDLEVT